MDGPRLVTLFLLMVTSYVGSDPVMELFGKPVVKGRVFGRGVSVPAKNLSECMEACTANSTTCDGVVFHQVIGKCRLISKCGSALQVDNSSAAVYYSRRPLIKSDGYLYVANSESCVGFLSNAADFAEADRACADEKGRLAMIASRRAAIVAKKLLSRAQRDWAWIGEYNRGNRVAFADGYIPEIKDQKDQPGVRTCWAINYKQQWGKFPCKNYTLPALCEIIPFPM